mgnify:CR=1 FL=1
MLVRNLFVFIYNNRYTGGERMSESRLNPDELLKVIQVEEENQTKGHLKIFFGYAAGVGKTYTMLKAAHIAKNQGVDVVAGYIEPHARPKTVALLNGLELLPTKEVENRDQFYLEDISKYFADLEKIDLVYLKQNKSENLNLLLQHIHEKKC